MKPGRIVLIVVGFIVFCFAYYCLFPKYTFQMLPGEVVRYNCITGEVEEFVGLANKIAVPFKGRLF